MPLWMMASSYVNYDGTMMETMMENNHNNNNTHQVHLYFIC